MASTGQTVSAAFLGYLTGSGTITFNQTCNPSQVAISISAPTPVQGALALTLTWTASGVPGSTVLALTTTQINAGINVQGSQIGLTSVDQIQIVSASALTAGIIKVFIGLYSGGSPPT